MQGLDDAHAVTARRSTTTALYPTRGVGLGRLGQDAGIPWLAAGQMTLHDLAEAWSAVYRLACDGDEYTATRNGEDEPSAWAATLEGLESAIRADFSRWLPLIPGEAR